MNRELIYSVQDSSEVAWDDLDEEIQREVTDLASDAFEAKPLHRLGRSKNGNFHTPSLRTRYTREVT